MGNVTQLAEKRIAAMEAVVNDALQILEAYKGKTDLSKCGKDIVKLIDDLQSKHFGAAVQYEEETTDTGAEAFRRRIKDHYRNQEDRTVYRHLVSCLLRGSFPLQYPVELTKQESPDFVIRDKYKSIGIECTQLMSKFEAEHCVLYQSALFDAAWFKEDLQMPNKNNYGIEAEIRRTGRDVPYTDGKVHEFALPNQFTEAELIEKARKLIAQKESKAETYKENGDFDELYLLVYARGMSCEKMARIEKAVKPFIKSGFDGICFFGLSETNEIEIFAPYEILS